jgi:hypothetical protein
MHNSGIPSITQTTDVVSQSQVPYGLRLKLHPCVIPQECSTFSLLSLSSGQSVLVITYREPDNPEYKQFQDELHIRAQKDFDVNIEPSLVSCLKSCHISASEPRSLFVERLLHL